MTINRRRFIHTGFGLGAGFLAFGRAAPARRAQSGTGYGALIPDPDGILDLPEGFSYRILSRAGDMMDDGFIVPPAHDGMASFAGPDGRTILVRNHELSANDPSGGPFGSDRTLFDLLPPERTYDAACLGGTTTLVYDTATGQLERHHLSLVGTVRNCAGGPTPWGSWVTCEETNQRSDDVHREDHGFAFEVPADAGSLVQAVPLRAMGRFSHEGIAVDPPSGVVYETEDRPNGLFYRFIPNEPGRLAAGGRLQALRIRGLDAVDTTLSETVGIAARIPMPVEWVDIEDVESPGDNLREQGAARGAAAFSRGEGIWTGPDGISFAATSGGMNERGQIWRYVPSRLEGTPGESDAPGRLELLVEPNDTEILDMADNIAVAPWGHLLICEDGQDGNFLHGLSPDGTLYPIAFNAMNGSELAGACVSPDRTTVFVNIQRPGLTLAITGPWT
jgi:hypothetical protein